MVTYGIHWSTAFSSSLILALGPVSTLLILRWQRIEVLTRPQVLGVAVSCAGVLVFLSDKLLAGRWQATTLPAGQALRKPEALFVKLDDNVVEQELARMGVQ
jgi:drug/metabolite transporter (DMT)-like permease